MGIGGEEGEEGGNGRGGCSSHAFRLGNLGSPEPAEMQHKL